MRILHSAPRASASAGIAAFFAALVAALLWLAVAPAAAQKDYRYENDAVRLGLKSVLEEGDLVTAESYFNEAIENGYRVEEAHRGLGEILLLQGRYDDAKAEFRKGLGGAKKVPESHAGLGLVFLREGKADEAAQAFEAALDEDGGLWRAKYGLARIAIQQGDLDDAEDLLKSGSKKKGIGDGEHLYRVGMALLLVAQGKPDDAESHALTALNLAPSDPDAVLAVGDVYEKKGVAELAISRYETILADPAVVVNKGQLHFRVGLLHEKKQQYADAIRSYVAAIEQDSTLAGAYLHAGALFSSANQHKEARSFYNKYCGLMPADADGLRRLAGAHIEFGDFPRALEAANKAVALDSTNVESRRALARSAAAMKQNDLALATYASLPEGDFDGRDYMNIGNVHLARSAQKELEADEREQALSEARTAFQTAVEIDSTLGDAYFGLGYLDLLDKDYATSEENLATAVRLSPTSAAAILNLGVVQMQLKKFAEATSAFKRASQLADRSASARVYLGQSYAFQEQYKEAEAAYKEALTIDPASAGAMKGLGFILVTAERCAEAEALLLKATEANPGDSGAWVLLGQARACQGKGAIARAAFERALAIDPGNKQAQDGKKALPPATGP